MYLKQGNTYTLIVMWVLAVNMGSDSEPDDAQGHELYAQHMVGLTHFDLTIDLQDALEDAVKRVEKGVKYTTQVPKTEDVPLGERAVVNR